MQDDKDKPNDLDDDSQEREEVPFFIILVTLAILFFLCWITCKFIFGNIL